MDPPSLSRHEAAEIASHLLAAKMFSLASCIMLFYDIIITFGDEVEKIWKQRFTGATVLWFMNRYISPLGYIVIIVSFHDPDWSKSVCNRYILYPEALKIVTAAAIGAIFILRLYSIYGGSVFVSTIMTVLLLAELAVKIWAFTDGTSVNLPPGLVGCILTGKTDANRRFVFTWVAELVFDTAVFVATLSRTLVIYQRHRHGAAIPLVKVMMRDGIVYFLVIFAANVVTVILFIILPPDLKAVNASFSTLITSLMVSRLILNLRGQAFRSNAIHSNGSVNPSQERFAKANITSTIIGNLGEPVLSSWLDIDSDVKGEVKFPGDEFELSETRKEALRSQSASINPEIRVQITRELTIDGRLSFPTDHFVPGDAFSRYSVRPTTSSSRKSERTVAFSPSEEDSDRRSGAWQPPHSWNLEDGVQLSELGKPRHSNSSS